MKKIIGIHGSPHKDGNTATVVREILAGAAEQGAAPQLFQLHQMQIKPCQACYYCKQHAGECALKDDMQTLHAALAEADAFVLGAPVYMWQMNAQTNALKPDLVALTGDVADIGATPEMLAGFAQLRAPAFFVWGNHDQFFSRERVAQIFRSTPITILRNEIVRVRDDLQIIGLDYLERHPQNDPKPILANLTLTDDLFTLLLSHAPIDFSRMDSQPIDLQLAGHTHAGQIFPFNLLVKRLYPRFQGLYTLGNRAIYVSSGTATWGPPMRLGTRNEITVIRLAPSPPGNDQPMFACREAPASAKASDQQL